ncbi:putative uncharacterized protein [Corallococcus sp. CAG:1435]|nr:putative uncharacterized protein [Corallococcus sp. CAG:1435]
MDATLRKIIDEIGRKPVRSSIITATALIDEVLKSLLTKFFVKGKNIKELFAPQGALGTFSAKINIAYSLGLISKNLFNDLQLFRKIRNDCAHNLVLDEKFFQSTKARTKSFELLNSIIQYPENEDLLVYTSLEFMFIFACLLKRINNIERIKEYEYEVHDDYLAFSHKDYEFIQNISKYLNENDKS